MCRGYTTNPQSGDWQSLARELCVDDWEFLAKGQRHAVFRYVSHAESPWRGFVVRFVRRTSDNPSSDIEQCFGAIEWLRDTIYHRLHDCVDIPIPVTVSPAVAKGFSLLAGMTLAPALDIIEDYTQCDLLVELKPKKGVIFASEAWCEKGTALHPARDDIWKRCCKHCVQQTHKIANGRVKRMSLYCPVELFQGGIEPAFEKLYVVPQNNLRVFRRGKRVDIDTLSSEEKNRITTQCSAALRRTQLLDRLRDLQRSIALDIQVLEAAKDKGVKTITYTHVEERECRVNEYRNPSSGSPSSSFSYEQVVEEQATVDVEAAIDAYFVSRSAQDASIMIQLYDDNTPSRTKIIDLDKKPPEKYQFWCEQEHELATTFRSSL